MKDLMVSNWLLRRVALVLTAVSLVVMGATSVSAATLNTDWECNSSEWHFVITGASNPPSSISVTFDTDGVPGGDTQVKVIPLEKVTGNAAHYRLPISGAVTLDWRPISTTYEGPGTIRVSHGPCPPVVPEVPLAAAYPVIGAVTFAVGYGIRRLRRPSRDVVSV